MSDIPDLTFSMDADEEKHILYEKTEVCHMGMVSCLRLLHFEVSYVLRIENFWMFFM